MPARIVVLLFSVLLAAALSVGLACQPSALRTPVAEAEAAPTPTPERLSDSITIAAVGDIMMGSTSINETFLPPNDGRDMFREVAPVLSAADIAFGNLEGPMLEGGKNEKCGPTSTRCFAFRVPTRYGQHLKDAGFDVLSLANNHASDFGEYGRVSTRQVLDKLGIKHAGSDREKFSTAYLDVRGMRVAVVAFAHNAISPNVNEIDAAKRLVIEADRNADIVVVSFHGGAEGAAAERVPRQLEIFAGEKRGNLPLFAHAVIDAGADLVLGHGPHVLRGMEMYKGRLIAYSMGNFATYGMFNLKGPQGLTAIFQVELNRDGSFAGGKIISARQEGRGGPVLDDTGAAIRKIRQLSTADFGGSAPNITDDGSLKLEL